MSGFTLPSVVGPLLENVARLAQASVEVFVSPKETFSCPPVCEGMQRLCEASLVVLAQDAIQSDQEYKREGSHGLMTLEESICLLPPFSAGSHQCRVLSACFHDIEAEIGSSVVEDYTKICFCGKLQGQFLT